MTAESRKERDIKSRSYRLKSKYGIDSSEWMALLDEQDGVCASCGEEEMSFNKYHTDHDHDTNRVRGILCHNCNVALGHLKDDPRRIRLLAEYIEQHWAQHPDEYRYEIENGTCDVRYFTTD